MSCRCQKTQKHTNDITQHATEASTILNLKTQIHNKHLRNQSDLNIATCAPKDAGLRRDWSARIAGFLPRYLGTEGAPRGWSTRTVVCQPGYLRVPGGWSSRIDGCRLGYLGTWVPKGTWRFGAPGLPVVSLLGTEGCLEVGAPGLPVVSVGTWVPKCT